jgi:hypothetical protein
MVASAAKQCQLRVSRQKLASSQPVPQTIHRRREEHEESNFTAKNAKHAQPYRIRSEIIFFALFAFFAVRFFLCFSPLFLTAPGT